MESWLEIVGAAEHNLKNISLRIPKNRFVVFTGVSGSGKSSLAFDTIYVEGQRKYIESLSSYARQFLGQLERPRYERITGLSPTVAIEQKTSSSNPRSTVGTVTEILDYLRVLYARVGEQRCPGCDSPVGRQDPQQIVSALMSFPEGSQLTLYAPLVRRRKGEFKPLFEELMRQGFTRFRIDGELMSLQQPPALDRKRPHNIDIAVDRFKVRPDRVGRIAESVETALNAGGGRVIVEVGGIEHTFSQHLYCDRCSLSLPELSPQLFSFNSPLGACPTCHGLGSAVEVDLDRLFTPPESTVAKALRKITCVWIGRRRGWEWELMEGVEKRLGIPVDTRVGDLTAGQKESLVYGERRTGDVVPGLFPGLMSFIERDLESTGSELVRTHYYRYFRESVCRSCSGTRLRAEARSVYVGGRSLTDLSAQTVAYLYDFFRNLTLDGHRREIAAQPCKEILARLQFLKDVGLEYLTLDRPAHTLSGGEAQRIRLARQLGTELSGVIYILDEPSVGLHQRDNLRLVQTLERLRDLGNTIIVVEHDRETIDHAEWVVDFGVGAGRLGGEVVYSGPREGLLKCEASITAAYLSGRDKIDLPVARRRPSGWLTFKGVRHHNLVGLTARIPLGVFTVVTGVSGAGKSSLVNETVLPLVQSRVNRTECQFQGSVDSVSGLDQVNRVITIDQKPIGRTPRSNPATYTKAFDFIRLHFSKTRDARAFGYGPGRFSFNVKGGRCERCQGDGALKIEMHFLPDVYIRCPQCNGKRFNDATLRVRYKGNTIADVLDMTVDEALELFSAVPAIRRILQTLSDVGLGYIKLGQPSPTLSGGEAQRIKLSRELAKNERGHTLYLLDEPTTGLHYHDIKKLLAVIARLVNAGHTVLMVEHNMEVIKCADWIIDLGPEGGDKGGKIVAEGPPEEVVKCQDSYTALFLRKALEG